MAGKLEVYQDKLGLFHYRLKAGNGEIILASEGYSSKTACINAIELAKKNSLNDSSFQRMQTSTGKYMFILKDTNQQVIGMSQLYQTESGRENGVESAKKNLSTAKLNDILF